MKRNICLVGFVGEKIVIPYKDIREIEKCYQGLFPMGIKKWLAFLEEKTGISVNA